MFRLINPVPGASLREQDAFGSGAFGASRDGGKRTHSGIDIAAPAGKAAVSPADGIISRLGYPYASDTSFRYVEITTEGGLLVRVFYVWPAVKRGASVIAGETRIGIVQNLAPRYPGITNHVHLEIKNAAGAFVDPTPFLNVR